MKKEMNDEKFSLSVFRPDSKIEIDGYSDVAKAIIHFGDKKLLIKKRGNKLIIDSIYGDKNIHMVRLTTGTSELDIIDNYGDKHNG